MSAINPVILMENALIKQKEAIAKDLAGSVVLALASSVPVLALF